MRSAISELVDACKALPDFDTLQILHFFPDSPPPIWSAGWDKADRLSSTDRWRQALREEMKGAKDWAISCLKVNTGRQEGDGKKRAILRLIELSPGPTLPSPGDHTLLKSHLGSVKVEEYEIWVVDDRVL